LAVPATAGHVLALSYVFYPPDRPCIPPPAPQPTRPRHLPLPGRLYRLSLL